jgi:hypothetical protein
MPEEEPGSQNAVGHTADNPEVDDVLDDAMSHILTFEEVVNKVRHIRFSLDELIIAFLG